VVGRQQGAGAASSRLSLAAAKSRRCCQQTMYVSDSSCLNGPGYQQCKCKDMLLTTVLMPKSIGHCEPCKAKITALGGPCTPTWVAPGQFTSNQRQCAETAGAAMPSHKYKYMFYASNRICMLDMSTPAGFSLSQICCSGNTSAKPFRLFHQLINTREAVHQA